jgi:hypothetical protein
MRQNAQVHRRGLRRDRIALATNRASAANLDLIVVDAREPPLEPPDELMGRHVICVGVPVFETVAATASLISSFKTNLTIIRLDLSEDPATPRKRRRLRTPGPRPVTPV